MASEGALIQPQFRRAPEWNAERHASGSTALQILLQKTYISQIYYANAKSLFSHPAIFLRNSLEICECRLASGATPGGYGTATFPTLAENFDLGATHDSE